MNINPCGLIQIAGIHDAEEAAMLAEEGVHWIGIPLRLAVHKEDLSESRAAQIVRELGNRTSFVLITYLHTADAVLSLCNKLNVRIVQLHGDISIWELEKIKRLDPDLLCIKSLVVRPGNLPTLQGLVARFSPLIDGFITDTFDPATGACGATGKTHDWAVSRALVQATNKPVILAGGLKPGNVADAIHSVCPFGVDAHTGVEDSAGRKDREKLRAFVASARSAFEDVAH